MSTVQLENSVCQLAKEVMNEVGQHLEKGHGGCRFGIECPDCEEKSIKKFDEIVAIAEADPQYSQSAVYGIISPVVQNYDSTKVWLAICKLCRL